MTSVLITCNIGTGAGQKRSDCARSWCRRPIQVAVLTDDTQRAASEIVRLMFCRWVQENDFKYLDKHFGINQITSYGVVGYEELREQVEDRQVRSAEIKALGEQRRQLRARQGRLLLLQVRSEHEAALRQTRIEE